MSTQDEFDKWYVLRSADAAEKHTLSTAEIVDAHERGVLKDRTVIYHRYASRREGLTVKELVELTREKK